MSEWQPISTAPKGKPVLLWAGGSVSVGEHGTAAWQTEWNGLVDGELAWAGGYDNAGLATVHNPTHWMPLPDPPDAGGE